MEVSAITGVAGAVAGAGAAAGAKIGLDGRQATESLKKIEKSYDEIMDQIVDLMQTGVVDALSGVWFGNDAVEFMREKLKPAAESAITSTERVFTSVNDTVTQAATNYDRSHNTNVFQKVAHNVKNGKLKTEGFKSDNNGFVGIADSSSFETARKKLTDISEAVNKKLDEAKLAAGNSGFHGGNQQEELVGSMQKIKDTLSNLISELNEASKTALTKAVERETELAKANAETFKA